jgi:hypothetical protein
MEILFGEKRNSQRVNFAAWGGSCSEDPENFFLQRAQKVSLFE